MLKIIMLAAMILLIGKSGAEAASAEHMTDKEEMISAVAALTAAGKLEGLKAALASALDAGLSVSELKEVLVQSYAYCGFPRSLNALNIFMELVKERGGKDAAGEGPAPKPTGSSLDYGTQNQTKLCGGAVKGELFEFAPAIDEYLKAHLFGDIFSRGILDWRTRELATVAMLSAIPGAEPQLKAHVGIARNNGLTEEASAQVIRIAQAAVNNAAK